jgi:hypothetical protein
MGSSFLPGKQVVVELVKVADVTIDLVSQGEIPAPRTNATYVAPARVEPLQVFDARKIVLSEFYLAECVPDVCACAISSS